jgi:hypothetical protein
VAACSEDEPGCGGTEHELEHLSSFDANLQTPAPIVHADDETIFWTAAKVRDAHRRANPGDGTRGAQHTDML